jgi:hypothetical protein
MSLFKTTNPNRDIASEDLRIAQAKVRLYAYEAEIRKMEKERTAAFTIMEVAYDFMATPDDTDGMPRPSTFQWYGESPKRGQIKYGTQGSVSLLPPWNQSVDVCNVAPVIRHKGMEHGSDKFVHWEWATSVLNTKDIVLRVSGLKRDPTNPHDEKMYYMAYQEPCGCDPPCDGPARWVLDPLRSTNVGKNVQRFMTRTGYVEAWNHTKWHGC